jgi:hypothetical protein
MGTIEELMKELPPEFRKKWKISHAFCWRGILQSAAENSGRTGPVPCGHIVTNIQHWSSNGKHWSGGVTRILSHNRTTSNTTTCFPVFRMPGPRLGQ